jgi:diaminopimelate decarboxylase
MALTNDALVAVAKKYGTPLYAYDLNRVSTQFRTLRDVLPAGAQIYFSLKANSLPTVSQQLRREGARAEVCSLGELHTAIGAGFVPEQMLYGGPAKEMHEYEEALAAGLRWFSIESVNDYRKMCQAATAARVNVKVLLRINPAKTISSKLQMTGTSSQFGIDEEEILSPQFAIEPNRVAEIVGVHVYFGTQMATVDLLISSFSEVREIATRVAERLGIRLRVINCGGGFPWPFATRGESAPLGALKDWFRSSGFSTGLDDIELWFESGRFLTAASGYLLASVLDVKVSKGKRFAILDTGINIFGGMSGLGRVLPGKVDFVNLTGRSESDTVVDFVGPLCTPLDYLGRNATVREPAVGDIVMVPNVGAYGSVVALTNFLRREAATEVCLEGGNVVTVSRLATGHIIDTPARAALAVP